MIKISKNKDKDFKILNLTDVHTENHELSEDSVKLRILKSTVTELVSRIKPDLITISGDMAWGGSFEAYEMLTEFMESFNTPWSIVWGNHDQEKGYEVLEKTEEIFSKGKHFLYEQGPKELGRGNFVIAICEDDRIIEGLIMMDTHNRVKYINKDGNEDWGWGKLYPEQFGWYKENVCKLTDLGCKETAIIIHQPIYAYNHARDVAYKEGLDTRKLDLKTSYTDEYWNEEFKGSFGINCEDVCCFKEDDGFFDLVCELGSTKTVIAGHDHVNCSCIKYKGVRLTYGLKTGMGAYWKPEMNGGTVLAVTSEGITDIKHEFVDPTEWIKE